MVSLALLLLCPWLLLIPLLGSKPCSDVWWTRSNWLALLCLALGLATVDSTYILRKLMGHLVMPVGLIWLSLFGLSIGLLRRGVRRAGLLTLALWIFVSVAGNRWVVQKLDAWVGGPVTAQSHIAKFDAVLLLGGATFTDSAGVPRINQAGDRLLTAARLFASGRTDHIVSYAPPWKRKVDETYHGEGSETVVILGMMGVPRSAITWGWGPINTRAEIERFAQLTKAKRWQSVGVVSTDQHLHRALYYARSMGFKVVPIGASMPTRGPVKATALASIPTAGKLAVSSLLAWEAVGLLAAMSFDGYGQRRD